MNTDPGSRRSEDSSYEIPAAICQRQAARDLSFDAVQVGRQVPGVGDGRQTRIVEACAGAGDEAAVGLPDEGVVHGRKDLSRAALRGVEEHTYQQRDEQGGLQSLAGNVADDEDPAIEDVVEIAADFLRGQIGGFHIKGIDHGSAAGDEEMLDLAGGLQFLRHALLHAPVGDDAAHEEREDDERNDKPGGVEFEQPDGERTRQLEREEIIAQQVANPIEDVLQAGEDKCQP